MKVRETRRAEVFLEFQDYISGPPMPKEQLYSNACSSDKVTVSTWRDVWLKNIKANHERFGSFTSHSVGKLFGRYQYHPAIIAGAGSSLKVNGESLSKRGGIPLISCLHNFHFFEDRGINVEYYVSLDAGPITIEEVSEGGSKSSEEYWEISKDRKLVCYIGTNPILLEKWRGEIYFFNCPIPDEQLMKDIEEVENFNMPFSNGGNVLGGCLYLAKGILGCSPIIYVGADMSFGYERKFHAWDSKYDKSLGQTMRVTDIYGNKVHTWRSYYNFKNFFEWISMHVPGHYINATEGGCLGAYPEGNIASIQQMELERVLEIYHMNENIRPQCENSEIEIKTILF